MKFLLDTNILIPVEPASPADIAPNTPQVSEFIRRAEESRQQVYVHPLITADLERDKDAARGRLRKTLLAKYNPLPAPPSLSADLESALGTATKGSHDWVDNNLLAAVHANAVTYLVTEDQGIHRKASRLKLDERVLEVVDAIALLKDLFDKVPPSPPAITPGPAHSLDEKDPIFESFRHDYPQFDTWLAKCKQQHRQAWTARVGDGLGYAGVCIVNKEEKDDVGLPGKVLKICSFKVSDSFQGYRLGELLLKTVFQYAKDNDYEGLFVTVFEKHGRLINLFEAFGFTASGARTPRSELVLRKELRWAKQDRDLLGSLEFNLRYGPFQTRIANTPAFIVPIQPRYHRLLFPDAEAQSELFPGVYPFGNAIRKAYLCHSKIRDIPKGSNVFFYRSEDTKGLSALGIVEGILRSDQADEIAGFVGNRTVYGYGEIEEMCRQPVLAILFRQVCLIQPRLALQELRQNGILTAPPQSIVTCPETGKTWLAQKLGM